MVVFLPGQILSDRVDLGRAREGDDVNPLRDDVLNEPDQRLLILRERPLIERDFEHRGAACPEPFKMMADTSWRQTRSRTSRAGRRSRRGISRIAGADKGTPPSFVMRLASSAARRASVIAMVFP
jgi:hypothetical protein